MALNPNALTDAAAVQARLRLANGTDQALIEQLINEASDALEQFTARKLTYAAAVVEKVAPRGGPKLMLQRTPLVSITGITELVGDAAQDVDPAEYEIHDAELGILYRRRGWPWSAQLMDGVNFDLDQQPGTERKTITVTYAGGYVTGPQVAGPLVRTLPSDLERACILAAIAAYRGDQRNKQVTQETVGRASRTYAGGALPPESIELATRYARWA